MTDDTFLYVPAELEVRARGRTLGGSFKYNTVSTRSDRGRVRKERIASDGFGWQLREFEKLLDEFNQVIKSGVDEVQQAALKEQLARRNTHALAGHDFNKPLGDRLNSKTLRISSNRESLDFEVDLPLESQQPTWMRDTVESVRNGLATGISPGFSVPPASVLRNAEELIPEPGNESVLIRQVNHAVLFEVSIVSRPAYASAEVELRAEDVPDRVHRRRIWL